MRLGATSCLGLTPFKVMAALVPTPPPTLAVSALCTPCLQILCSLHLLVFLSNFIIQMLVTNR